MRSRVSVYGLSMALERDISVLRSAATDEHRIVHVSEAGPLTSEPTGHLTEHSALLPLRTGGHLRADRQAQTATIHRAERLTDAELVHPGLTNVAAVFSHWMGRLAFHGGAVASAAGAWAVLGPRESGKSTLLTALALRGYPVLADDLVVLIDGRVAPGPPSLDLRADAAQRMAEAVATEPVRGGERHRVHLPRTATAAPMVGIVALEPGETPGVTRLPPSERIAALYPHRMLRGLPASPERYLDLAPLPAYRVVRPTDWAHTETYVETVVGLLGPPPPSPTSALTARSA